MRTPPAVVITGAGAMAPGNPGTEAFWQSVVEGRSGVGPISLFDAGELGHRIAGEVRNFNLSDYVPSGRGLKRLARHAKLGLAAAVEAARDAGLAESGEGLDRRIPVIMGVSTNSVEVIEFGLDRLQRGGARRAYPPVATESAPQAVSVAVSRHLGLTGTAQAIGSGCASSLDAIDMAARYVREGRGPMAIAGGADAGVNLSAVASFGAAGVLTDRNEEPEQASRPFDRDRNGGVLAEGAGVVVVELLEHALGRGVRTYAEICGYASVPDPNPTEPGGGLAACMELAIANAGCEPRRIDYVCAHAPSDLLLDAVETAAIKKVFGERAYALPVSSIKGVTGNPLGAAGVLQVIAACLAMRDNLIPMTTNYAHASPECDLDYVAGAPRRAILERILINNHGLGGVNSCLVLGRPRY